jgi:hypothetical protein
MMLLYIQTPFTTEAQRHRGKARDAQDVLCASVSLWFAFNLHAEDAELGRQDGGVERCGNAEAQRTPRLRRVEDAVVPDARGGVVGMALSFVLLTDRRLEFLLVFFAPLLARDFHAVALDGGQHRGRLFPAHHTDTRVRPHPEHARAVGAAAHAVVAGAEAAADDHGELRHLGGRHCGDHLRAVLGDAAVLVLAADHEAGDVLQE